MSWNKPCKALATERYDRWLAEEGINQGTQNIHPPLRRTIINEIFYDKKFLQSISTDGPEDDYHSSFFFKEYQPSKAGKEILALTSHPSYMKR